MNMRRTSLSCASVICLLGSGYTSAFEFQLGDTDIDFYGYAQLGVAYDDGPRMSASGFRPYAIRPDGMSGSDGHLTMTAHDSRFGLSALTPTSRGPLKIVLEADLRGNDGGGLRLRHAYGQWNNFLAGQTWTNFSSHMGLIQTIDTTNLVGRGLAGRLSQIRYTYNDLSISLEDPSSFNSDVSGASDDIDPYYHVENKHNYPVLTVRYGQRTGSLNWEVGGVARKLTYHNGTTDSEESEFGWGANTAISYAFDNGVRLHSYLALGDGIGGYATLNPGGAGYIDGNGDVETVKAAALIVGISVPAGPGKISAAYARVEADLEEVNELNRRLPQQYGHDRYESVFLNYIWSPVARVSYGIEGAYHKAGQVEGPGGDTMRLQGMIRYRF